MSLSERPDLSGFHPSQKELSSKGKRIDQLVSLTGGDLVTPCAPRTEQDRQKDITDGQQLAAFIRSKLNVRSNEKQAIALADWSAVNRTYQLLCQQPDLADPFVALADFATIVGACIFYDHVVFIDDGRLAHAINTAMYVPNVFVALSPQEADSPLPHSLDAHYSWAFNYFNDETQANAPWLMWLEESWKSLLPGIRFPEHRADAFDTQFGYTTSPDRKSWIDVIFQPQLDSWVVAPSDIEALILDNDLRALTYDRLAQTLDHVIGQESGFFTRYIGGCLRSPLQLARAKDAEVRLESAPALEQWLVDVWRARYPAQGQMLEQVVRLPFWAGAVFARCKGDAHALPEEIATCRQQARALRKRRAELEEALRQSRIGDLSPLAHAVAGELDQLTTWVNSTAKVGTSLIEAGATATLKCYAPTTPAEVVKPIAEAAAAMGGAQWLKKLALRLFRPHVYFVYAVSQEAGLLGNVLQAAARVLPIGGKNASQPTAFLTRLRKTEWLL